MLGFSKILFARLFNKEVWHPQLVVFPLKTSLFPFKTSFPQEHLNNQITLPDGSVWSYFKAVSSEYLLPVISTLLLINLSFFLQPQEMIFPLRISFPLPIFILPQSQRYSN